MVIFVNGLSAPEVLQADRRIHAQKKKKNEKKELSVLDSSADVLKDLVRPTAMVGNELADLQDFLTLFAFKKVQIRQEKPIMFQQKQVVLRLLSACVMI